MKFQIYIEDHEILVCSRTDVCHSCVYVLIFTDCGCFKITAVDPFEDSVHVSDK